MLDRHSSRSQPDTRVRPWDWERAASARPFHFPRQNHLLAALPIEDFERLLPDLEPVPLRLHSTIYGVGDRENYLYFLTSGLVSRFYVTESGASAELTVTGSEGAIGIASFLGGESTSTHTVVLSAGQAYRLRVNMLKNEFARGGSLLPVLLRYTHALIEQTGQMAVCNRHHSVDQRLCRWILTCVDRLPSNELKMTQELIANMLGVRREGVTEAAGKLHAAGLIHLSRGHIAVLDRHRLESQACECYAVVKQVYDRLPHPENATADADACGTQRQHFNDSHMQRTKLEHLYPAAA